MEYRAENITALLTHVRSSSLEEGAEMLKSYGDIRESRGIENGWNKCTQLHRKCRYLKNKRDRAFILEEDPEVKCTVELHELNKLLFFITDELERIGADDLVDLIKVKTGSVKIDRRLTFIQ